MRRRDVLKLVASTAAGAGLLAAVAGRAAGEESRTGVAKTRSPGALPLKGGDGTTLFHRDWGTGQPFVFVHGWGLHSAFWEYQMTFLAGEGFRCVAFDRRSHGRSADPGRGYDFDTLADDLAAVVNGLDLRNVV